MYCLDCAVDQKVSAKAILVFLVVLFFKNKQ